MQIGAGFTLIELMVTIAVAAILLAIGVPSFRDFVAGQRVRAASSDIVNILTYARSEAIKRNTDVEIAPATGGWQNGWTVTAGGQTLNRREAFSGLTISGPTTTLAYAGTGRLKASVESFAASSSVSPTAGARCVSIELSGLPSSKNGSC